MAWPARLRLEKLRDKSTRGKRKRPFQRKRSRPPKRPFLVTGSALASGYVGASNIAALATDDEAFCAERPVCAICGHFKGEPVQKAERPTGKKKPAKSCRTSLEGTHSQ